MTIHILIVGKHVEAVDLTFYL